MGRREVSFAKLPNIDNVPVQNQFFGLDTVEVCDQFVRMAAIGS